MYIVLPIQIKKSAAKTANVNVIDANNVFCDWLKEIDAKRYPDVLRILPKKKYSQILSICSPTIKTSSRQVPRLYKRNITIWKIAVFLIGGRDRRSNMSTAPADRKDSNLGERITNFLALIGKKCTTEFYLGFLHP